MSEQLHLVDTALKFYRSRTRGPAGQCVRDGMSCSQRFERAHEELLREGISSIAALLRALNQTYQACAEINGWTTDEARATLLAGTVRNIIAGRDGNRASSKVASAVSGVVLVVAGFPFGVGCPNPGRAAEQTASHTILAKNLGAGVVDTGKAAVSAAVGTVIAPQKHGGKNCP